MFALSWVADPLQGGIGLAGVPAAAEYWIGVTSTAIAVPGSARDDHAIGRVNIAQDIAGNFLDKIWVGPVGRQ